MVGHERSNSGISFKHTNISSSHASRSGSRAEGSRIPGGPGYSQPVTPGPAAVQSGYASSPQTGSTKSGIVPGSSKSDCRTGLAKPGHDSNLPNGHMKGGVAGGVSPSSGIPGLGRTRAPPTPPTRVHSSLQQQQDTTQPPATQLQVPHSKFTLTIHKYNWIAFLLQKF